MAMASSACIVLAILASCCEVQSFVTSTVPKERKGLNVKAPLGMRGVKMTADFTHVFDAHALDMASQIIADASAAISLDDAVNIDTSAIEIEPSTVEAVVAKTGPLYGLTHLFDKKEVVEVAADADAAPKEGWKPLAPWINFIETTIRWLHTQLTAVGVPYAYGISIFLFTLAIKAITLPLNYQQIASTTSMQKLAPRTKMIKKWYRDNDQVLQSETARMYDEKDVNPLAGCLPSLAQIPIFIGLYRAINQLAAQNEMQEGFLWIPSLSGPIQDRSQGISWLTQNWVDGHPPLGWEDTIAYCILPVLLVLAQRTSMDVLSPPETGEEDESTRRTKAILKYLPFMIGWFSLNAPAGLGLYWFCNSCLTTAQTLTLRKILNYDSIDRETKILSVKFGEPENKPQVQLATGEVAFSLESTTSTTANDVIAKKEAAMREMGIQEEDQ